MKLACSFLMAIILEDNVVSDQSARVSRGIDVSPNVRIKTRLKKLVCVRNPIYNNIRDLISRCAVWEVLGTHCR